MTNTTNLRYILIDTSNSFILQLLRPDWMQPKRGDEAIRLDEEVMECFCLSLANKITPGLHHPELLFRLNNSGG